MKASGIIRNVDPLGRVVIPKEMRKILGINEGDPLEIAKVNNDIILRKYSKGWRGLCRTIFYEKNYFFNRRRW